jgi:hypothetical protein
MKYLYYKILRNKSMKNNMKGFDVYVTLFKIDNETGELNNVGTATVHLSNGGWKEYQLYDEEKFMAKELVEKHFNEIYKKDNYKLIELP